LLPDPTPGAGLYYRSDHFSFAHVGVPAFSVDQGDLFVGHDLAFGRAQAMDYDEHHYHQPSDEYRADWDFRGNAKLARFGFAMGWLASDKRDRSSGFPATNSRPFSRQAKKGTDEDEEYDATICLTRLASAPHPLIGPHHFVRYPALIPVQSSNSRRAAARARCLTD